MSRKHTRINTQKGLAPIVAIIIALLVVGGGGYAIKKGVDMQKEKKVKADQEEIVQKEQAEKEAAEKVEKAKIGRTITVKLGEVNKSGQSGEAVITQTGTSTVKVIVNITGKPSKVAMPSHIHVGACPTPGDVKYALTNVDKGAAQTELPITLDQLVSELPLAINVHKSATEAKTYVACGNLEPKIVPSPSESTSVETGMPVPGTETKETVVTSGTEGTQKETIVTYDAKGFSPKTVTIKKGETVVFENKTGARVSVASNDHPTHLLYPEFDQYKTDAKGKDEFRFTFEKVGTWNYHDHLNASMGGTVVVTE